MSDIERGLRELDREGVFPPTPDLVDSVTASIADTPAPTAARRRPLGILRARPAFAIAVAVALAAGAVLGASPGARSAILDLLGLQSARIERGELGATPDAPPDLGRDVSMAEARRLAGFELAVPTELGRPARIGFSGDPAPGGQVSFAWTGGGRRAEGRDTAIVMSQMRAAATPLLRKTAPAGTHVEHVEVAGRHGYWLAGAPHGVELLAPDGSGRPGTARLAASTLLWEHGRLLLRLEGAGSKSRALEIARSLR